MMVIVEGCCLANDGMQCLLTLEGKGNEHAPGLASKIPTSKVPPSDVIDWVVKFCSWSPSEKRLAVETELFSRIESAYELFIKLWKEMIIHRDAHKSAEFLAVQRGNELYQCKNGEVKMEHGLARWADEVKVATELSKYCDAFFDATQREMEDM
ncbi:uncharacterized protein A4U43_C04F11360 [Asparagus officinalis]|uniref:Uncharacterized protein n=1 Tax=Asparagus officinalis TaxID=4686 RepID=A0A5P1F0I5_ASPOF|nr:uncharacterized protein A4U43_C04F11360 [Asparagus officinalis]